MFWIDTLLIKYQAIQQYFLLIIEVSYFDDDHHHHILKKHNPLACKDPRLIARYNNQNLRIFNQMQLLLICRAMSKNEGKREILPMVRNMAMMFVLQV